MHEGPTINETVIWVSIEAKEGGLCHVCPHCVVVEEPLLAGHTL